MSKEKIIEALQGMDPLDDDQWTQNGDPKVDYIKEKTGLDDLTRQSIFEADTLFNRERLLNADSDEDQTTDPEDEDEDEDEDQTTDPEDEDEVETAADALANLDEPLTEQQFAEFLRGVSSDELRDIEGLLKEQQIEVSRQADYLVDLKFRVKRALGFVQSRIKREVPDSTNAEAIRTYLESQKRQRAERAAKRDAVFGQFGDLKDINPRSPLDQAMARKTKRGGKRPTRQLLK